MVMVGLAEAAKLARRSQSTIHRAMAKGTLSYTVGAQGARQIDVAELARAFNLKLSNGMAGAGSDGADMANDTVNDMSRNAVLLQRELEIERQERERERQEAQTTIADLRKRLDRADERLLLLLTDQRAAGPAGKSAMADPAPPSSVWRRFMKWRR